MRKLILIILAITCSSCACGGGGCSIGGSETHQLMNERLQQTKAVEVQAWRK